MSTYHSKKIFFGALKEQKPTKMKPKMISLFCYKFSNEKEFKTYPSNSSYQQLKTREKESMFNIFF